MAQKRCAIAFALWRVNGAHAFYSAGNSAPMARIFATEFHWQRCPPMTAGNPLNLHEGCVKGESAVMTEAPHTGPCFEDDDAVLDRIERQDQAAREAREILHTLERSLDMAFSNTSSRVKSFTPSSI
jgi:hypothetical protein